MATHLPCCSLARCAVNYYRSPSSLPGNSPKPSRSICLQAIRGRIVFLSELHLCTPSPLSGCDGETRTCSPAICLAAAGRPGRPYKTCQTGLACESVEVVLIDDSTGPQPGQLDGNVGCGQWHCRLHDGSATQCASYGSGIPPGRRSVDPVSHDAIVSRYPARTPHYPLGSLARSSQLSSPRSRAPPAPLPVPVRLRASPFATASASRRLSPPRRLDGGWAAGANRGPPQAFS